MRWSYSSIKLFEQCPRKYFHLRVVKDVNEPPTDAMLYGTQFHEAAEHYIRNDVALPPEFKFVKGALDALKFLPGDKLCEYEMGLTEDLHPCAFDAENVWYRGIADLLILNHEKAQAKVVDYKTGKSAKYADPDQLQLMALCVFKHFPTIRKVKAGLLFVMCNAFPKANFETEQQTTLWSDWVKRINRLNIAYENSVWNPKPSGLCKAHCPVLSCSHNGRS